MNYHPVQINNTQNILIISYDENLNDFNINNINQKFENYILKHKYIILLTQKSKSSTTKTQFGFSAKHFQHIFKTFIEQKDYNQVDKYDSATPFSAELTDNYSLRIRIFKKKSENKIKNVENITFSEIKNGSFRNYFRNTANKTALLCRLKINGKFYNIINTDLFSLKTNSRPMYNDGLLYKEQQFLAIIKDFKLYDKYAAGENIILAGSLKFNIYPLKMTNILNFNNRQKINQYLIKLTNNNIKKYNELYKYLNKLMKDYNKSNQLSTNLPINITKIQKYKSEHDKIHELLEKFKDNLKMIPTGTSSHEKISSAFVGSIPKTAIKITESFSRGSKHILNSSQNTSTKLTSTRSSNTISCKDRILYALPDKPSDNPDVEYNIFDLEKSNSIRGNNKFVTLSINNV
jgi:hypothetical protein